MISFSSMCVFICDKFIPNEDFLMKLLLLLIVMEIMLKVMVWVLDMEVDKMVQSGGWWMCKIYELY